MKSAWFWSTPMWAEYQQAYYKGQVPDEYKTSPLDLHTYLGWEPHLDEYTRTVRQTVVLDLTLSTEKLWHDVRKSYHSLIHRAQERYVIVPSDTIACYAWVHAEANGGTPPRSERTYECQDRWLGDGLALLVEAWLDARIVAAAYWIVYQGGAYYASGPSIERSVQHAVLWHSLALLKGRGVRLVELGQIDGATEKECSVGQFKRGFGGVVVPFTTAIRRTT